MSLFMILPLLRVNHRELFQSAFPYLFFQERFCIKPEQAAVEHVVSDKQDCKQIHYYATTNFQKKDNRQACSFTPS